MAGEVWRGVWDDFRNGLSLAATTYDTPESSGGGSAGRPAPSSGDVPATPDG